MADWPIDANETMRRFAPIETMIVTASGVVIVGPAGLMGRSLDQPTFATVKDQPGRSGSLARWVVHVLSSPDYGRGRVPRLRLDSSGPAFKGAHGCK